MLDWRRVEWIYHLGQKGSENPSETPETILLFLPCWPIASLSICPWAVWRYRGRQFLLWTVGDLSKRLYCGNTVSSASAASGWAIRDKEKENPYGISHVRGLRATLSHLRQTAINTCNPEQALTIPKRFRSRFFPPQPLSAQPDANVTHPILILPPKNGTNWKQYSLPSGIHRQWSLDRDFSATV